MGTGLIFALVCGAILMIVAILLSKNQTKKDQEFKDYKNKIYDLISRVDKLNDNTRNEIDAMFETLESMVSDSSEGISRTRLEYEKLKAYYKGKFNIPLEVKK